MKTLRRRLLKRRDSAEEITRRLESAGTELGYAEHYHHIIPSGTIEENEAALHRIYRRETETSACASAAAGPEESP
ncbi:MAG: hypothetical protein LBD54_02395 [Puniceicoccales bacterium]|nr:hypothetical protein [Puniceicoccales bacterium]